VGLGRHGGVGGMNAWAPAHYLLVKDATCPECQGFGAVPASKGRSARCPRCRGKGRVREEVPLEEALAELGVLEAPAGRGRHA